MVSNIGYLNNNGIVDISIVGFQSISPLFGLLIILTLFFFFVLGYFVSKRINKISENSGRNELSGANVLSENEFSDHEKQIKDLKDIVNFQKGKITEIDKEMDEILKRVDEEVLKRTKELHSALEKSAESNRLKDAFLDKISREIRTPLNSILGFINLIDDPNLSNIDREHYLRYIRESGNNLLGLIDNIVDFAKLETGEISIEYTNCNFSQLLSDLADKYRNRLIREKPEVTLIYNKPDKKEESLADSKRVLHILEQIINNAVKYTNKGKIELVYKIEDNYHIFEVSDTGIGIEKKYQDTIFERFYQIEVESQDAFSGAGLGLTIAKGVTELLKGELTLSSKYRQGSVFTLKIPFKETKIEYKSSNKVEKNYNWNDKTILVAEDEDSNYFFLEAILKKTKVNIIRADDGVKFLELINENKQVDLVLLDIKMPGINGFNAIKVIRQQNIKIPVIAQTAFNQVEDKQRCLDSGCDDYLAKPLDRELLISKIARFFEPKIGLVE